MWQCALRLDSDSRWCALQARRSALELGFSPQEAAAIAIAAGELASNALKFGREGEVTLRLGTDPTVLELLVRDQGPGIGDIASAIADGYSDGQRPGLDSPPSAFFDRRGLGHGLGAVKRLMDTLEISSTPGLGTEVLATKQRRQRR